MMLGKLDGKEGMHLCGTSLLLFGIWWLIELGETLRIFLLSSIEWHEILYRFWSLQGRHLSRKYGGS